jgi:hypothetical protein
MKPYALLIVLSTMLSAVLLQAQPYTIDWYTIDGGGGTSTGGAYSLSGTIGQPDAGMSSGGSYAVTGGFWGIVLIQTPGAPTLNIAHAASGFATLSWNPAIAGFVLQIKDDLTSLSWSDAPSGSTNPITVPTSGSTRFYRLRKP